MIIELRPPPSPRISAAALASARSPLLDHLQGIGLLDIDQFAMAIADLTELRQRCGQDVVHRQAAANLLAAIVTLRCGLGSDVVYGILKVAVSDNDRVGHR